MTAIKEKLASDSHAQPLTGSGLVTCGDVHALESNRSHTAGLKCGMISAVTLEHSSAEAVSPDVLVEFLPGRTPGLAFFGYADELAKIIGRKVDLNTPAFLSRHFRDDVRRQAITIYQQA